MDAAGISAPLAKIRLLALPCLNPLAWVRQLFGVSF